VIEALDDLKAGFRLEAERSIIITTTIIIIIITIVMQGRRKARRDQIAPDSEDNHRCCTVIQVSGKRAEISKNRPERMERDGAQEVKIAIGES